MSEKEEEPKEEGYRCETCKFWSPFCLYCNAIGRPTTADFHCSYWSDKD